MKSFFLFSIVFVFISCTKELDLPFPMMEDQIVVNGILHPDSLIKVSVSKTLGSNTNTFDFPVINNAKVFLYENDKLLDEMIFQDSFYIINQFPKPGVEYTIEVEVTGYPLVKATDIIPVMPLVKVCYLSEERTSTFRNPIPIQIIINDPPDSNYYWLHSLLTNYRYIPHNERDCDSIYSYQCPEYDSSRLEKVRVGFNSSSIIIDRFNAFTDNTANGVMTFDGNYIRFDDFSNNGSDIELEVISSSQFSYVELPTLTQDQSLELNLITGSQHYDRYLKSSILYYLNNESYAGEDLDSNPFAQPVMIYSNIENGTGIFAAYNSVLFQIEEHPCE